MFYAFECVMATSLNFEIYGHQYKSNCHLELNKSKRDKCHTLLTQS